LADRFLNSDSYVPEDEIFLTKIYWLSVLISLGSRRIFSDL
jgi:hypothetical protein